MELFWAVTAPITFFIAFIALYFVLESQYELRQFGRLFVDVLKLKGWKWPITKAAANSQRNYLRRLRKYRVSAVPVEPGTGLPRPGEVYYLKAPEIEHATGRDELPVWVGHEAYPDEFRFDETNGRLFHDGVDEDDYMYYARVGSPSMLPVGQERPLSWKRSRMVMEKEPYRFKGAFEEEQKGSKKFLSWRYCNKEGKGLLKPRWDTGDTRLATNFTIGPVEKHRSGQLRKLSVSIPEPPTPPAQSVRFTSFAQSTQSTSIIPLTQLTPSAQSAPSAQSTPPAQPTYKLVLIPVATGTP